MMTLLLSASNSPCHREDRKLLLLSTRIICVVLHQGRSCSVVAAANLHILYLYHPKYEPLQYPLLFPRRTLRWGCIDRSQRYLPCTQLQWYRHILLSESRFKTLGRVACEYVVDMFSRAEEERLTYMREGRRN